MRALHHVQVACPVGGEREVREFYGGLLGLDEVDKPPELAKRGGVWFRGEGYELHVGVEEPFTPARKAHPAFLVDDVDELADRIEREGLDLTWDSNFPAYRRFHLADPHGNRVEILGTGHVESLRDHAATPRLHRRAAEGRAARPPRRLGTTPGRGGAR